MRLLLSSILFWVFVSGESVRASECTIQSLLGPVTAPKAEAKYLQKLSQFENKRLKVLYELTRPTGEKVLNESEVKAIREIFTHPTLPEAHRPKAAFDLYLNARIKNLSETEQEKIRAIAFNHHSEIGPTDAAFNKDNFSIFIHLPKSAKDSVFHYVILAHELEHAIQYMKMQAFPRKNFESMFIPSFSRYVMRERFLTELGAMKSELELINAFPREEIEKFLKKIERIDDSTLHSLTTNMLKTESVSPEAHVIEQWNQKRYSYKQVRTINLERNIPVNIARTFITGGLSIGAYELIKDISHFICDHFEKEPKSFFCPKD